MESAGYQILQLTDMHLFADPAHRLLGVNTQDSLEAVFELVKQLHPHPDMICVTGDMSQDETVPAYERLAQMLAYYHCPKYWVPGNHDDTEYIESVFEHYHIQQQKHIVLDHWQIIMLDTKKIDAVEGYLKNDQLSLLDNSLASFPEHPTLIFMHHHPIPIGCRWLDNLMLTNADQFWDVLEVYNNVKMVVCGHVHQETSSQFKGVKFYSTPSTCFQFKRGSAGFAVEPLMPGYRVIELFPDGTFKTDVYRIADFVLNLDDSKGGY